MRPLLFCSVGEDKPFLPGKDLEWFFFSPRDRKYPNGSRTNRATKAGYWKATGKDRKVVGQCFPHTCATSTGMKKTLVYYKGRAPHGIRTDWVMHEYRLIDNQCHISSSLQESYALCKIFKKSELNPKAEEQQGEISLEEESCWIADDYLMENSFGGARNKEDSPLLNQTPEKSFPLKLLADALSSENTKATLGIYDKESSFVVDEATSGSTDLRNSLLHQEESKDVMQCTRRKGEEFYYPPLEIEDFPHMDALECIKRPVAWRDTEEYILEEKGRNESRILEEILHLASSDHIPSVRQGTTQSNFPCLWDYVGYSFMEKSNYPNQELQHKIHMQKATRVQKASYMSKLNMMDMHVCACVWRERERERII